MPEFPSNGLTLVSLFAGCGGSSLGYKMAGYDVRLAVDWDPKAASTYRANFPSTPFWEGDVANLGGTEALRLAGLPEGALDVLDGSPPCQGFSTAVKSKDTAWEVAVRSALWRLGLRFRKNDRRLPGTPDIVFRGRKVAVFLDSCFWHACPLHGATPKANGGLWAAKFRRNRGRDAEVDARLSALGWRSLRVWSHEADPVGVVLKGLANGNGHPG